LAKTGTGPVRSPSLWLLFGLAGRISRAIYWLCYFLLFCLQSAIAAQLIGGEAASFHALAVSVGPYLLLVVLYCTLAISVKRLHDVGYSGFLAVAVLIPFLNVAFAIWVGILPGTAGPNAYGDAPDTPPA
jgi:uncharacterized membrane protein YhaH (DUF805 family)